MLVYITTFSAVSILSPLLAVLGQAYFPKINGICIIFKSVFSVADRSQHDTADHQLSPACTVLASLNKGTKNCQESRTRSENTATTATITLHLVSCFSKN